LSLTESVSPMLTKKARQEEDCKLTPSSPHAWDLFPPEVRAELLAGSQSRNLRPGEILYSLGDVCDGCYLVESGVLKLSLTSPQGEECILAILSAGTIVGDLEMIAALPRSAAGVAISQCSLQFISQSAFQNCVKRHPAIHQHFAYLFARRLQEMQQSIAAFAFLDAKARVAQALLNIAESLMDTPYSDPVVIPRVISQKELAALAGVARENINRILRCWEERKLLTRLANAYQINDRKALERELMK
jgi:CRP/FNR family cyclic AMP-dependent transcriptional regulator